MFFQTVIIQVESPLSVARGLPADGRLLCCDVNEEWTGIARRYWSKAGVANKIELRIGPALDTLRALPRNRTFDFAWSRDGKQLALARGTVVSDVVFFSDFK